MLNKREVLFDHCIETRLKPANLTKNGMGEIRSLVHNPWSGGELWEEWAPIFEQNVESFEYVASHWQWTPGILTMEDAEDAFWFQVILQIQATFEAADLWKLEPPASEETLAKWTKRYGELPYLLKCFLKEVTAGDPHPEEEAYFHFHADDMGPESPYLCMTFDEIFAWNFEEDSNERDDVIKFAATALEDEPSEAALKAVARAVVVHLYFEGNHGDNCTLMLRDAPWEGQLIYFDTLMHGWQNHGHVKHGGRFSPWLRDALLDWFLQLNL